MTGRVTATRGLFMVRLALTIDLLGWAFILALPGDTFGRSRSYYVMAMLADEQTWSVLLVYAGLFSSGLLIGGGRVFRWIAAAASALFQAAVTVSFGAALSTGTFTHAAFLILALWTMWEIVHHDG